jgi:hypothetical protein
VGKKALSTLHDYELFLGVCEMEVDNDKNANDNNQASNITLAIIKWFAGIIATIISGVLVYYLTHLPSDNNSGSVQPPQTGIPHREPILESTKGSFCCDTKGKHRCPAITPLQIGTECLCDGLGKGHICE